MDYDTYCTLGLLFGFPSGDSTILSVLFCSVQCSVLCTERSCAEHCNKLLLLFTAIQVHCTIIIPTCLVPTINVTIKFTPFFTDSGMRCVFFFHYLIARCAKWKFGHCINYMLWNPFCFCSLKHTKAVLLLGNTEGVLKQCVYSQAVSNFGQTFFRTAEH